MDSSSLDIYIFITLYYILTPTTLVKQQHPAIYPGVVEEQKTYGTTLGSPSEQNVQGIYLVISIQTSTPSSIPKGY